MTKKQETAQSTARRIRRKTRKKYSMEDKILIVIEELRVDLMVAELCR
jgi:transposase